MTKTGSNVRVALNDFFVSVQVKALRQAEFAVKNKDDAMDIVQDAMERLAKNYADRPDDWGPLFQRILQNAIRDWYRRQKMKRLLFWSDASHSDSSAEESYDHVPQTQEGKLDGLEADNPERHTAAAKSHEMVLNAVAQLPLRQQQAFILRAWWGNDVAETAFAMSCSAGSVKTHYSRAMARLKQIIGDEI